MIEIIPIIEGAKEDAGFKNTGFCDEWCPFCGNEVFNIPGDRVSLCPFCRAYLFPCSICSEQCDWSREDETCHRFPSVDKLHKSRIGINEQ